MRGEPDLFESESLVQHASGSQPRVDRERGVIHNVKVLGWNSKRGYRYEPAGVDPALYEGRPVCFDHKPPGTDRSVQETRGWLEGVQKREDGLYAERLYLADPTGPEERRLLTLAEKAPHLVSLSHSARAGKWGQGRKVVESVAEVESVDLVRRGATNATLYEGDQPVSKKIRDLIESLKKMRPGYARALQEAADSGVMGMDMDMPEPDPPADPVPEPAEMEAADHTQALKDACKAVLDDESLDVAAKLKKIKTLLGLMEGETPVTTETETETETEETETEEGWKGVSANLREEYHRLKAKDRLRTAADAAGVKVPALLLESVRADLTDEQAKKLVEELKGDSAGRGKPGARSATPDGKLQRSSPAGNRVQESAPVKGGRTGLRVPDPSDRKAMARFLRTGH